MLRLPTAAIVMVAAGLLPGCARVPQESVELSVTVGRDLAELHRANRELAVRYFARMQQDVETFVNEVYRPFVIRHTMEQLDLVGAIQQAAANEGECDDADESIGCLDPLDIMEIYAEETLTRIASFRDSMLAPVLAQQGAVLDSIDVAYQRVQNANAVVTGHLASVKKVHDAQAEFLSSAGVGDLRQELSGSVSSLSDRLAEALQQGRKIQQELDQAPGRMDELEREFSDILGRVRGSQAAAGAGTAGQN